MTATLHQLGLWMAGTESEHVEFKEAKATFDFDRLVKYCAALANERGGALILGVTDARPRRVVGSRAFDPAEGTKAKLVERLRLRVEVSVLAHPDGRVVVFEVPSRPIGMPVPIDGAYYMRAGDALVTMTADQLQRIFAEGGLDFSAEVCPQAAFVDLDPRAIAWFRAAWLRKSQNAQLEARADSQLLEDAELTVDGKVTYAALVLLGTRKALGRHLAQAEVVFEYRSSETSIESQQRAEHREGFFLFQDALWSAINQRNDLQHFQEGLFIWDVPTFGERVVREALLNAIAHRDYRLGGSVFVRQSPRNLVVVSPGGFPPGVTAENILHKQSPRNRRIAEALARCGLVERSGQGADRMFEESIRQGKPRPDFSGTDDYQVMVTLRGQVQDPRFLQFLERVGKELQVPFATEDLIVLDALHRGETLPRDLLARARLLRERGVVESVGRGRGQRFLLSRRFHQFLGTSGTLTRQRGLDRETNKALLLKHLDDNPRATIQDFEQVLRGLSRNQIHSLLKDLKRESRIKVVGVRRGSRWVRT